MRKEQAMAEHEDKVVDASPQLVGLGGSVEVVRRPDGSQVMVIPDPPEDDPNYDPNFKHTPRPTEGTSLGFPTSP